MAGLLEGDGPATESKAQGRFLHVGYMVLKSVQRAGVSNYQ